MGASLHHHSHYSTYTENGRNSSWHTSLNSIARLMEQKKKNHLSIECVYNNKRPHIFVTTLIKNINIKFKLFAYKFIHSNKEIKGTGKYLITYSSTELANSQLLCREITEYLVLCAAPAIHPCSFKYAGTLECRL